MQSSSKRPSIRCSAPTQGKWAIPIPRVEPKVRIEGRPTCTVTAICARITPAAIGLEPPIYRGNIALDWIPKKMIIDSDTDLDEIEPGEEITIEIPLRFAREKGLVA